MIASQPMTDYAALPDRELVRACQKGDRLAGDEVVNRYSRLVYAIPMRGFRLSAAEAEDIFQECWAAFFSNLGRIRRPEAVKVWLVTSVMNLCRKQYHRSAREAALDSEAPEEESDGHEDQATERFETRFTLWRVIRRLEPRCQEILFLRYFSETGLSYQQISKVLAIPRNTVGTRLATCLRRLKGTVAEDEEAPVLKKGV